MANDSADDPSNSIRLMEENVTAGIVEVRVEGKWRTVCSAEFTLSAALVACLQLGFYGAYSHNSTTKYVYIESLFDQLATGSSSQTSLAKDLIAPNILSCSQLLPSSVGQN